MVDLARPTNPYDFRGEIEDRTLFAGRGEELGQILEELRQFKENPRATVSMVVVGPRRIGKSSLLLRVIEVDPVFRTGS